LVRCGSVGLEKRVMFPVGGVWCGRGWMKESEAVGVGERRGEMGRALRVAAAVDGPPAS